jgi:hypothetical protein
MMLRSPQASERLRGQHNIQESRTAQPSEKRFAVQRMIADGDLWVTEYVFGYDGVPSYALSIMEFSDRKVARDDPFKPGPGRARLIKLMWRNANGARLRSNASVCRIRSQSGGVQA